MENGTGNNKTNCEPEFLTLKVNVSRDAAGNLIHLAVYGFPVEWSDSRILEDARRAIADGTGTIADQLIIEAGGYSFPQSTGGPECRLYVDKS